MADSESWAPGTDDATAGVPARSLSDRILFSDSKTVIVVRSLASLAIITGLWELAVRVLGISHLVLPAPSDIATVLYDIVVDGIIWKHLRITTYEIGAGFVLGCLLGVVVAFLIVMSRVVDILVYPYVIALNSIPKIALAPIMITWFGFGIGSKILMALLITFFPVLINTIAGLRATPREQMELMKVLDAPGRHVFLRVRLPNALPYMFAGFEVGIVVSVIGAIVGEFVGAKEGLGYLLVVYNSRLAVPSAFAILVVLGAIGMVLHRIVVIARRLIVHWQEDTGREEHLGI